MSVELRCHECLHLAVVNEDGICEYCRITAAWEAEGER